MLIGGELKDGLSYPYFEMSYFSGRTENPTYIQDSSLKRIKSIKYHEFIGSNASYFMLFDTTPLKVGVYSQNAVFSSVIFQIAGMSSQSIKPSSMAKSQYGFIFFAGTNSNNRFTVASLNVNNNQLRSYEVNDGYADSLHIQNGILFVVGYIQGDFIFSAIDNNDIESWKYDQTSINQNVYSFTFEDTNTLVLGNGYILWNTCLLSPADEFLFINMIINPTQLDMISSSEKVFQPSGSIFRCVSIQSMPDNTAFAFLEIDSNMYVGTLNFQSNQITLRYFDSLGSPFQTLGQGIVISVQTDFTQTIGYFVGSTKQLSVHLFSNSVGLSISLREADTSFLISLPTSYPVQNFNTVISPSNRIVIQNSFSLNRNVIASLQLIPLSSINSVFPSSKNPYFANFTYSACEDMVYAQGGAEQIRFFENNINMNQCIDYSQTIQANIDPCIGFDYNNHKFFIPASPSCIPDQGTLYGSFQISANNGQVANLTCKFTVFSQCYYALFQNEAQATYGTIQYTLNTQNAIVGWMLRPSNDSACPTSYTLEMINGSPLPPIFLIGISDFQVQQTSDAGYVGKYQVRVKASIKDDYEFQYSDNFEIQIQHMCGYATITTVPVGTSQYDITSGVAWSYTFPGWTRSLTSQCPELTYQIFNSDLTTLSSVAYITSGSIMSILETNTALIGQTVTFYLRGNISTYTSEFMPFTVQYINCSTNEIFPTPIANISYICGSGSGFIPALAWSSIYPVCGNLVYSMEINNQPHSNFPFIVQAFNPATGQTMLYCDDIIRKGLYQFKITGTEVFKSKSSSSSFTVQIMTPCQGQIITEGGTGSLSYEMDQQTLGFQINSMFYDNSIPNCGDLFYQMRDLQGIHLDGNTYLFNEITIYLQISSVDYGKCNTIESLYLIGAYTGEPDNLLSEIIYVSFTCSCANAQIPQLQPDFTVMYEIGGPSVISQLEEIQILPIQCFQQAYVYFNPIGNSSVLPYTFDALLSKLTLDSSNDLSLLGSYEFLYRATATIQGTVLYQEVVITVKAVRSCNYAVIQAQGAVSYSGNYLINGSLMKISFPQLLVIDPISGICGSSYRYTIAMIDNGLLTGRPNFITLSNSQSSEFSVQTTDLAGIGTYLLVIRARLYDFSQVYEYQYQLTLFVCQPTQISVPSQKTFYRYSVGESSLIIPILRFTMGEGCQDYPIDYSASLTSGNAQSSSGITYLDENVVFVIFASSISQIGKFDYTIKGSATVDGKLFETTMTLRILITGADSISNTAPYFEYPPQSIKLLADTEFIYELPSIIDDQSDQVFTFVNGLPSFSDIQNNNLVLKPKNSNIGIYPLNIILKDLNKVSMSSTYNLSIEITDIQDDDVISSSSSQQYLKMTAQKFEFNGIEIIKDQLVDKVDAYIADIDQQGNVKVAFEREMLIPNDIGALLEFSALKFYLKRPSGEVLNLEPLQPAKQNDSRLLSEIPTSLDNNQSIWNISEYERNVISLKLIFPAPQNISSQSLDTLEVYFKERYFFVSSDMKGVVDPNYRIQHQVPPQVPDDAATRALKAFADASSSALKATVSMNIFLSLFLGISMSKMWLMISTLQIVVHLPMLKMIIPANALLCFSTMVEIANLNMISKEQLQSILGDILPPNDEKEEVDENFRQTGYGSTNLLSNMGLIFIGILGLILLAALLILIGCLMRRCACTAVLMQKLNRMIFFNAYLRSTMKGYLNFAISTLISLTAIASNGPDDYKNLAITMLLAFYLMFTPLGALVFFQQNSYKLSSQESIDRYGSLYLNLRTDDQSALRQTVLYFARRLLFAYSIVFFGTYPLLQAAFQVFSSMGLLMYTIHYKPYTQKDIFYFEIFNEGTLLAISYFLLVFCDILVDNDLRYSIGWCIVLLVLINVFANWLNLVISVIKGVCLALKQWLIKKKKAKIEHQKKSQTKQSKDLVTQSPIKEAESKSRKYNLEKKQKTRQEKKQTNTNLASLKSDITLTIDEFSDQFYSRQLNNTQGIMIIKTKLPQQQKKLAQNKKSRKQKSELKSQRTNDYQNEMYDVNDRYPYNIDPKKHEDHKDSFENYQGNQLQQSEQVTFEAHRQKQI